MLTTADAVNEFDEHDDDEGHGCKYSSTYRPLSVISYQEPKIRVTIFSHPGQRSVDLNRDNSGEEPFAAATIEVRQYTLRSIPSLELL